MKDQGYDLNTVIKEDNKSSILLMRNGRLSSGKRTKHLDIRYFYVKDLLERGIVELEHCATEDMIADFFMKPIQGKKFQIMRDIILNRTTESALQYRSVLENSTQNNIVQTDSTTKDISKTESEGAEGKENKRAQKTNEFSVKNSKRRGIQSEEKYSEKQVT
jgi:hypothetical protein